MSTASMTGFGRAVSEQNGVRAEVEISSVNRKQFDCDLSIPAICAGEEEGIRTLVHASMSRGSVRVAIRIAFLDNKSAALQQVNREGVQTYVEQLRQLADAAGIPFSLSLSELAQQPCCFTDPKSDAADCARPAINAALLAAIESHAAMRRHEGSALRVDLEKRLAAMETLRLHIAARAPLLPPLYRENLLKRIGELEVKFSPDDPSIRREVALYADRCDIAEELTRLKAHFSHAVDLFNAPEPCGRKLDFLCQEMNRETNTIGSKAGDTIIAHTVVELKALIETFREQVQNLE
ncbi:MAG: YicC/YloC family endoribonuclease [Kiritimatiellia bacterium]